MSCLYFTILHQTRNSEIGKKETNTNCKRLRKGVNQNSLLALQSTTGAFTSTQLLTAQLCKSLKEAASRLIRQGLPSANHTTREVSTAQKLSAELFVLDSWAHKKAPSMVTA